MTSDSSKGLLATTALPPRKVRPYASRLLAELRRCASEATAIPEEDRQRALAHLDALRALLLPHLDAELSTLEAGETLEAWAAEEEDAQWSEAYNALCELVRLVEAKAGMRAGGYQRRIEAGAALKAGVSDVLNVSPADLAGRVKGLAGLLEKSPTEIADAMDALLRALKAKGRA